MNRLNTTLGPSAIVILREIAKAKGNGRLISDICKALEKHFRTQRRPEPLAIIRGHIGQFTRAKLTSCADGACKLTNAGWAALGQAISSAKPIGKKKVTFYLSTEILALLHLHVGSKKASGQSISESMVVELALRDFLFPKKHLTHNKGGKTEDDFAYSPSEMGPRFQR